MGPCSSSAVEMGMAIPRLHRNIKKKDWRCGKLRSEIFAAVPISWPNQIDLNPHNWFSLAKSTYNGTKKSRALRFRLLISSLATTDFYTVLTFGQFQVNSNMTSKNIFVGQICGMVQEVTGNCSFLRGFHTLCVDSPLLCLLSWRWKPSLSWLTLGMKHFFPSLGLNGVCRFHCLLARCWDQGLKFFP